MGVDASPWMMGRPLVLMRWSSGRRVLLTGTCHDEGMTWRSQSLSILVEDIPTRVEGFHGEDMRCSTRVRYCLYYGERGIRLPRAKVN